MNQDWKDRITKAGYTSDGHVTNGSMREQEKVIDQMLDEVQEIFNKKHAEFIADLRRMGAQCLHGGHKARNRMFQSLADRYEKWSKLSLEEISELKKLRDKPFSL